MEAVNKYRAVLMPKGWLPVSGPEWLVHTAARRNKPLNGHTRMVQARGLVYQYRGQQQAASHPTPWATFPVDMKGVVLIKVSGPNQHPDKLYKYNPGIHLLF